MARNTVVAPKVFAGALALLVAASLGCDNSGPARQRLAREGFTDVQLTPQGEGFAFTARRGSAQCTGTIRVSRGLFSSSESLANSCIEGAAP